VRSRVVGPIVEHQPPCNPLELGKGPRQVLQPCRHGAGVSDGALVGVVAMS